MMKFKLKKLHNGDFCLYVWESYMLPAGRWMACAQGDLDYCQKYAKHKAFGLKYEIEIKEINFSDSGAEHAVELRLATVGPGN
jgi:hypothetical protein